VKKSKALRLAGFVGALCVSGTLLGTSISGTGAYFTDSHNGAINASTGHVTVNTSDLTLNFTDLLPGDFKSKNIDYTATGTSGEDIWLVLPSDTVLNGGPDIALGRYGHFAVASPAGSFTSFNLRKVPDGVTDKCSTDINGHGGSNQEASSTNNSDPNSYVPYCPVPNAILLSSGLTSGQGGTATVTFGYTKILKGGQNQGPAPVTTFKIVATQAGIRPDDVNS
jgi:hypothetical protein